jgi:hypothetical protein
MISERASLCRAPRERLGARGGHPLGGFRARIEFPEALSRRRLERARRSESDAEPSLDGTDKTVGLSAACFLISIFVF